MSDASPELTIEKDRPDGGLLVTISVATVLSVVIIIFVFMGLWQRRADQLTVKRVEQSIAANYDRQAFEQRNRLTIKGEDPVPADAPAGTKPTQFVPIEAGKAALLRKLGQPVEPR